MQQTIPVNDGYKSSYVGTTPSTGPFDVDFPFFSLNDVVVALQADGTEIQTALTRGADYDLVGVATEDGSFSGGAITLYLAVANTTVIRFRTTPVERLSNFPLQGFFSRLALNAELNKITVWMQELHAMLGSTSEASQAHAPVVSPIFVGDPKAPTPLAGDNDTSIATTAFVVEALVGVGAAIPSGTVVDYAGSAAPAGWLLCVGQTLSRAAYPALFTAIGTTYNVGGELETLFRLPDLRGRVTAAPDSGGSNRLNTVMPTSDVVGTAGGSQNHVLIQAELAAHSHYVADPGHLHASHGNTVYANIGAAYGYAGGSGFYLGFGQTDSNLASTGITLYSTGSNLAHNNTQPTLIVNKIIKT